MQPNLTLILNTHMPHVLGRGQLFSEPENWLFEAITETYIPLLTLLANWRPEHHQGKNIILSMTPCLVEQLLNCRERYLGYLEKLHTIASFERERTSSATLYNQWQKHPVDLSAEALEQLRRSTDAYLRRIELAQKFMAEHDLIDFIKTIASDGLPQVQLWTSTPNHNFLPFFEVSTQEHFVRRGVELFESTFGRSPDGLWLPECAYKPGVENALIQAGVRKTAMALPAIEPYHPKLKSGVYQFRELEVLMHDFRIAQHIWQAPADTLPSNPIYREFYRDIGHDVKPDYFDMLGLELPTQDGKTKPLWTSIKHHALATPSVNLGKKPLYDINAAREQTITDAKAFVDILRDSTDLTYDKSNIILAFDTEIFGHWWYEGIWWLEHLLQQDFADRGMQG